MIDKVNRKIVILGGKGVSTVIVYNALKDIYPIEHVILEQPENLIVFLKRRIKRLGWVTVLGQLAFQVLIVKWLKIFSQKRINEIINENKLNREPIPTKKLKEVDSVNSDETIRLLNEIAPDLIVVNGTRIISKKVIGAAGCKLINTHAGITPRYRGVHGTYWALVNDDASHSGVTVHFVDAGIDTGKIIDQRIVIPTKKDNFVTYPFLQLGAGIELLVKAIDRCFKGENETKKGTDDSFLWVHPTIWFYLAQRIKRGVK